MGIAEQISAYTADLLAKNAEEFGIFVNRGKNRPLGQRTIETSPKVLEVVPIGPTNYAAGEPVSAMHMASRILFYTNVHVRLDRKPIDIWRHLRDDCSVVLIPSACATVARWNIFGWRPDDWCRIVFVAPKLRGFSTEDFNAAIAVFPEAKKSLISDLFVADDVVHCTDMDFSGVEKVVPMLSTSLQDIIEHAERGKFGCVDVVVTPGWEGNMPMSPVIFSDHTYVDRYVLDATERRSLVAYMHDSSALLLETRDRTFCRLPFENTITVWRSPEPARVLIPGNVFSIGGAIALSSSPLFIVNATEQREDFHLDPKTIEISPICSLVFPGNNTPLEKIPTSVRGLWMKLTITKNTS